ncbi:ribonuclease H-like domain-containing protein [Tanacetum coccineum]
MTGNMSYLTDYEEINGGYVAFGGNPKGGKITVRVPRKNNMYSVDLKNIVPKGGLTCLFAKATSDESELWHRRLGHINFKTMNKLVKGNLVRVERKNRTLIKAARTMLADSKLPTTFWVEAVNTACFMKPFGCPVTILNTIDHLGKFDGKAVEGFFIGYSINSKAFRVFNSRTRIVEENLHVQFSENTPNIAGSTKACDDAGKSRMETVPGKDYILLPLWIADPPFTQSSKSSQDDGYKPLSDDEKKVDEDPRKDSKSIDQEKDDNVNSTNNVNVASINEVNAVGGKTSIKDDPNMPTLEDIVYSDDDEDVGVEADMNNLDTTI